MQTLTFHNYNLRDAEEKIIRAALADSATIIDAAALLGITRHSLKRRIFKYDIAFVSPHPSQARRGRSPRTQTAQQETA